MIPTPKLQIDTSKRFVEQVLSSFPRSRIDNLPITTQEREPIKKTQEQSKG